MSAKAIIGITVIIGAIILFFLSGGFKESSVFYMTPDEFAKSNYNNGEKVRLMGRVELGSVKVSADKPELQFFLEDDKTKVLVRYKGNAPESFAEGRDVVAEGKMASSVFEAKEIIVKCPSKYQSKLEEKSPVNK